MKRHSKFILSIEQGDIIVKTKDSDLLLSLGFTIGTK